ncbi:MAG: hypothetical protein H6679_03920 [Epsilonproteobacteria bacterium]|nr:hypothetical protein [Campylobacterota bacterium]
MKRPTALLLLILPAVMISFCWAEPESHHRQDSYPDELDACSIIIAQHSPDKTTLQEELEHVKQTQDIFDTKPSKHVRSRLYTAGRYYTLRDKTHMPHLHDAYKIKLETQDLEIGLGGRIRDEFFFYNRARTLRDDCFDRNEFFRHKLNLDFSVQQGAQRYGTPASQAFIRLTNYVRWQNHGHYMPMYIDDLLIPSLPDVSLAQNVKVKNVMPLIFTEEAWFKINFNAFTDLLQDRETYLKVGYFRFFLGRGIVVGYHDDLAVDYLGWPGEGLFARHPHMPPGLLLHHQIHKNIAAELYYMKWREVNNSHFDVSQPVRRGHLKGAPERGRDKDRDTVIGRLVLDYKSKEKGKYYAEPYWAYTRAPEQQIEAQADASSHIHTLGLMFDWKKNNMHFNFEVAGQMGHQQMHGLDRNLIQLVHGGSSGAVSAKFSHIDLKSNIPTQDSGIVVRAKAHAGTHGGVFPIPADGAFKKDELLPLIVNNPINKDPQVTDNLKRTDNAQNLLVNTGGTANSFALNSQRFGNNRFRLPYRLSYRGIMALADMSYEFEKPHLKAALAVGYIGGDNYPYNNERDCTYHGFIPMRSRYKGLGVQNMLIFDRLAIPRPVNISHRTFFAFNNTKDLSNLQFLGAGLTWYPLEEKSKLSLTLDVMSLWEAAQLQKWDKNGTHPDPDIEKQIAEARKFFGFSGWESKDNASKHLGVEVDLKLFYEILNHSLFFVRMAIFVPGNLYKDLLGQPNELTIRVTRDGFNSYQSLGNSTAFALIMGINYRF